MKLIALVTAVVIWLFASADRVPREPAVRLMRAEVTKIGTAPGDLIVRVRQESIPITVSGPKSQVDGLTDGDIKAEVNLTAVRPDVGQLRIAYTRPVNAPDVQVMGQQTVSVDVASKVSKPMLVSALYNDSPPAGTSFADPMVVPERADVVGSPTSVERVKQLVVFVETSGGAVSADLPIRALDRDKIEVTDVEIQPPTAHVQLALRQAPAQRTLVVNPVVRGRPAPPFSIATVDAQPDEVTVTGRIEQLHQMVNVPTEEVSVEGIAANAVKDVRLVLPPGVTVKSGPATVRVSVTLRDGSKPPG